MTIRDERGEYLAQIRGEMDRIQGAFDDLVRRATSDNNTETLVKMEEFKKTLTPKGNDLLLLLDQAESAAEEDWERLEEEIEAVWVEYREVADSARLEMERAEELA